MDVGLRMLLAGPGLAVSVACLAFSTLLWTAYCRMCMWGCLRCEEDKGEAKGRQGGRAGEWVQSFRPFRASCACQTQF